MSLFSIIPNSNPETPFIKVKMFQSFKLDFCTASKRKQERKDSLEEDMSTAEITKIAEKV